MAMTIYLSDAQHRRFMEISGALVEAHINEDAEPEGASLLLEYSVPEHCSLATVVAGTRTEELGEVETREG